MAGWTCPDKDRIIWDGPVYAKSFHGDGNSLSIDFHPHQDVTTTASPSFRQVEIVGGNGDQFKITAGDAAWDATIRLDNTAASGEWALKVEGDNESFQIANVDVGGVAAINILPNRRVGIGVASPQFALEVEGDIINQNNQPIGTKLASGVGTPLFLIDAADILYIGAAATTNTVLTTGGSFYFSVGGAAFTFAISVTTGNVGIGNPVPTLKLDVNAKSGNSLIGGFCIKLTNKTGSNTVAGQLVAVYTTTAIDDAFVTCSASDDNVIGIVLDAGVSDGSEAWVVVSGIADVLMDAGGSARGDRIISSATAGSGDVWNTGGAVATHFLEIGHCIETRTGAGLARCVLHFN